MVEHRISDSQSTMFVVFSLVTQPTATLHPLLALMDLVGHWAFMGWPLTHGKKNRRPVYSERKSGICPKKISDLLESH